MNGYQKWLKMGAIKKFDENDEIEEIVKKDENISITNLNLLEEKGFFKKLFRKIMIFLIKA